VTWPDSWPGHLSRQRLNAGGQRSTRPTRHRRTGVAMTRAASRWPDQWRPVQAAYDHRPVRTRSRPRRWRALRGCIGASAEPGRPGANQRRRKELLPKYSVDSSAGVQGWFLCWVQGRLPCWT